tara:strand:+ start:4490 stop:5590 length:1101 start_codon:yes stop_codon:yes gene_type:complete
MKILKIVILSLILLNLPSIARANYGLLLASVLSYTTILLLVVYYIFEKKTSLNSWLISLALSYFLISSLQYYGSPNEFIFNALKYFIVIICGYELTKRVNKVQLFYFLIIGALSIGIEALFFPSKFGRYAGFYINANVAGFISIFGYSLTFGLKSPSIKLIGQFIFTLMGLLTFSRTFIVIWILLNLISLKINIKNIRVLGIGILIFGTLIFIDELVGLNNPRFQQLKAIVTNEKVSTAEINEGSRTETWAMFYDKILDAPIIGNGYGTFSGKLGYLGAHNTYLMIIGEAGILPFLIFLSLFAYLTYWSIYFFKLEPNLIMQTIALAMFLLANHNFFTFYFVTFCAMWIQYQIEVQKKELSNPSNI